MSPIMELLYGYILERPIMAYYQKSGYYQRREAQKASQTACAAS